MHATQHLLKGLSATCLLAAASLAQCPPAVPTGNITMRVSFKRILDPNGLPTTWPTATVNTMFAMANTYLANLGTNLTLAQADPANPVTDLIDPGIPSYAANGFQSWWRPGLLAMPELESAAEADPARYAWRPDAINVYLVSGGFTSFCNRGGLSAYPPGSPAPSASLWNELVVLKPEFGGTTPGDMAATFVHEILHYCDVFHTSDPFGAAPNPANNGCSGMLGNAAVSGDFVVDTPFDPGPGNLNAIYQNGTCSNPAAIATLQSNLMSFHNLPYTLAKTVTPGQIARARTRLWATRRHVVVGCPVPQIVSTGPSVSVSPGPTQLTINGTNLPTTNLVVQVGRPICNGSTLTNDLCNGAAGSPTACAAEAVSAMIVSATATQVVAQFAAPLPPGRHAVSIRRNGRVVAVLQNAIEVRPWIETMPEPLNAPAFSITARSATPGAQLVIGLGTLDPNGPTVPGITGRLWLSLAPSPFFLGSCLFGQPCEPTPIFTTAAGTYTVPVTIAGLLAGSQTVIQVVELVPGGTSRFSDPLLLTRP